MTQRLSKNKGMARRFLSVLLAALVCMATVTLQPTAAYAAIPIAQPIPPGGQITAPGLYTINGASAGTVVEVTVNGVVLTGTNGDLSVQIGTGITLTLWSAHITSATPDHPPIAATDMGCGLFLVGDNTATATAARSAGVSVPPIASLAIYGPGSLTAQGFDYSAGIGGDRLNSGNIEIRHTTVTATGGISGAGIGGGNSNSFNGGNGYNITVTNARVTATGGVGLSSGSTNGGGGAGIGGSGGIGFGGVGGGGGVSLTDSLVLATGGNGVDNSGGGAGIGGGGGGYGVTHSGNGGACDDVSLTNSLVLVTGGAGGDSGGGGSAGGGGGGAGIGGGGGGAVGTGTGGDGGSLAGTLSITDVQLAAFGSGGNGGPSALPYASGNGALCGGGGGGGGDTSAGYGGGGSTDANGAEAVPSLTASGPSASSITRPNTSDPGYLAQIPAFTGQPSPATILAGGNASFTVAAAGGLTFTSPVLPLTYQWQSSPDGGVTWTDITDGGIVSGAQTNTLTLTGVPQAMNGGWYRCVAMDAAFQDVYSNDAPLAVQALSNDKDITGFTIQGANGVINQVAGTINVTLPYGTDVRSLAPAITLSPLATVSPASGAAQDFTNPVDYTVTAQDGTTRTYRVTVAVAQPSSSKDITGFSIQGANGVIDQTTGTITLSLPYGTDVRSLAPAITLSPLATVSPASGVARDFTSPVDYTVTAQDGTTRTYRVTVAVQPSSSKDITGFSIQGVAGVIDPVAGTIAVTLPYGADVRALAPSVTVSPLATVSPASGAAQDFTNPVDYTVTAQDGTTRTYRVTVAVQPAPPPRPPSNLPRTGDSFPMAGLGAALLVMGLALAGTGWLTFRRRVRR